MVSYTHLTPTEHVLRRPGMYIGSTVPYETTDWIFEESIVQKQIVMNDGLVRLYTEALCNAIDNKIRSKKMTRVDITISGNTCSVENDGYAIPVSDTDTARIPEMIFGNLHSGSNFGDDTTGSGTYGLGIKLCNLFSTLFTVTCCDPGNKTFYEQKWENNMSVCHPPKIKVYSKTRKSLTRVEWTVDTERVGTYTPDIKSVMHRMAYDAAMVLGKSVAVTFNSAHIIAPDLLSYVSRFDLEYPVTYRITTSELDVVVARAPADRQGQVISFVNGVRTVNGGVHVDAVTKSLMKGLAASASTRTETYTAKDFVRLIDVWVVASGVVAPKFESQTKSKLVSPPFTLVYNKKWASVEPLKSIIQYAKELWTQKADDTLRSATTTKPKRIKIPGYDPANLVGKKGCTLVLCEGLSAKTYAVTGVNDVGVFGKKGRDYFGVFALRGKFLNVRNATHTQILANKEVVALINILGLKHLDYSESTHDLNYDRVIILCDSDTDGGHITGLLLNFFDVLYPTILKNKGFLTSMLTPVASVTYNNKTELVWKDPVADCAKIRFLKGLGSATTADIHASFGKCMVVWTGDKGHLKKVFGAKFADTRKEWISKYTGDNTVVDHGTHEVTVDSFVKNTLVKFSIDNCTRSLPGLYDGLKQSQRKILFAATGKKMCKVSQLAGYVSERTQYHHGEQCLNDTITKMAQTFVGSNNIPILENEGQFGCLATSTKVLLWNGTLISAKDVMVGMYLMGDDRKPRKVLHTTRGQAQMYTVLLKKDNVILAQYTTTGTHRLVLCKKGFSRDYHFEMTTIEVFNTPTSELAKISNVGFEPDHYIEIEIHGYDNYYGWETDGNNKYTLDHGIITHNSRLSGGKDAASSRYIHTRVTHLMDYVFRKEDLPVLTYSTVDGESVEPVSYFPIIPMLLVNGSVAIATGWSTNVPSYNPLDLIKACREWIGTRKVTVDLVPWVQGFKGTITKTDDTRFVTHGVYTVSKPSTRSVPVVTVTELPVGTWTDNYKEHLETLVEEGIIQKLKNLSTATEVLFEFKTKNEDMDVLKLSSVIRTTNLVVTEGEDKPPVTMDGPKHIIERFCEKRLNVYEKRIAYTRESLSRKKQALEHKLECIEAIRASGSVEEMCKHTEIASMPVSSLTDTNVSKLKKEISSITLDHLTPEQTWLFELAEFEKNYLKSLD